MRANVQQVFGLKPVRGRRIASRDRGARAGRSVGRDGASPPRAGGKATGPGQGLLERGLREAPRNAGRCQGGRAPKKLGRAQARQGGPPGAARVGAARPTPGRRACRRTASSSSLPDPKGGFQRFLLGKSNIMAPGLQAKHPDIATFSGRGIDDPNGDDPRRRSPLGFHASVRDAEGQLVHRPLLPPRPERLRLVLRPRRAGRDAGKGRPRSSSATRAAPSSRSTRATTTPTTT